MHTAAYVSSNSLAARTSAWLKRIASAAAPRPHLRLDPDRCALLVIDMLRYFAAPEGRCFLPAAEVVTPRIAQLLAAWRRRGAPVAYTQHCHEGQHDLGMLGRFFGDHIRAGEPDAEIVAALAPAANEPVLRKRTYDAFLGTGLEDRLRAAGCTQVLISGVLTHMCCETTARAAFCRGFEVYVAVDATASTCEERHLQSLLAMADCVAVLHSTEEILKRCATNGS